MIKTGQEAIKGNRIYFLDNLRTFMIFLVVLYHAGGVYESSGIWASFWLVDDPSTNNLSGILNLIIEPTHKLKIDQKKLQNCKSNI